MKNFADAVCAGHYDEMLGVEPDAADEFEGFVVGDIVSLVTGSPDMVVVDVCECGSVDVVWYDEDGFNEASLPEEALYYA